MSVLRTCAWGLALLGLLAGAGFAVNVQTVPVGDPGNSSDGTYGYGSVGYRYDIGKYEVTAGQYGEFLNKVAGVDTYGLYNAGMANTNSGSGITRSGSGTLQSPYAYSVAADFVNRPVNYVSFWDACRFANWLHNGQPAGAQGAGTTETGAYTLNGYTGADGQAIQRNANWKWAVTSENEWYKAAYYKGGSPNAGYWSYPTRSSVAPGRDMADVSGNNANYNTGSGPYPIDGSRYTTLVGEFQNSAGPYGTFDQGGNVQEWDEALVTAAGRGVRGGSFSQDALGMVSWPRGYLYPDAENQIAGFRVVAVPEPATMLLMALAGVGMVRRGKHNRDA